MKVALCLFGVVGGSTGKAGKSGTSEEVLKLGYEYYKKNIFEYNDVDVFIHCWNTDFEQKILETYRPVSHIIEKQKVFEIPPHVRGAPDRKQNHYSRWYSTQQSINLAYNHSNYDIILSSRFDIAWTKKTKFQNYAPEKFWIGRWSTMMKGGQDLFEGGKGKLYEKPELAAKCKHKLKGYPHDKTNGLLDLWFFSGAENMYKFGQLYDHLDKYTRANKCPLDRNNTGNISSHQLALYHLDKIGLKNQIKESDHYMYDDFPLIRRKFFGCKK